VVRRGVYSKTTKDKVAVRKYLIIDTHKGHDRNYPAFVTFFTDYSPGRKEPLQTTLRSASPLENAVSRTARSVDDILPNVLGGRRMDRRRAEAEVVKVWNSAMDPNVAAHAQPAGIRNGTLFVTVDSNVWLAEIVRYRRREILDRLQHSFGSTMVQKISYRVG